MGEFGNGVGAVFAGGHGARKAGVDVLHSDSCASDGGSAGIVDGTENGAAESLSIRCAGERQKDCRENYQQCGFTNAEAHHHQALLKISRFHKLPKRCLAAPHSCASKFLYFNANKMCNYTSPRGANASSQRLRRSSFATRLAIEAG